MNRWIAIAMTAPTLCCSALALALPADADARRDANAKQVASAWAVAWLNGNTAVAAALSEVPFDFSGQEKVESLSELQKLLDAMIAGREPRPDLRPSRVVIKSSTDDEVRVQVEFEGEPLVVIIKPGEVSRVVGVHQP